MVTQTKSEPRSATLTFPEMKLAISRIDKRIGELNSFEADELLTGFDASRFALEHKLDELLKDTFGHGTVEYRTYKYICELYVPSLALGKGDSIYAVRSAIRGRILKAIEVLKTIKSNFIEKLEEADISGSEVKAIKAYGGLELQTNIAAAASSRFRSGHYADAIESAMKALNEMVREKSGSPLDGSALMQLVFSEKNPILALNDLKSVSDKDEQRGFMNMMMGAVWYLRNPRAHENMEDEPSWALEAIATISFLAKGVDKSKKVD